ncbi:hypothetical protein [Microlunatus soli]|uniref:Protein ImuA n=1 Tax=Microlunatus soli TaxID=630515 RepID=A0A1H2AFR9_9ACTN|nr:hypothetical protein [Microlunatus soli]SDT44788.1 hypothetical protein SAMN04489812_5902 [Microlunatus soli]
MTVTSLANVRSAEQKLASIQELRQQVHRMQGTATSQPLPTLPALSGLVQLRTGASYAVSTPGLAMLAMAGPSAAGSWSAVIGMPDFGLEAAAELGVDLDRTVLVPEPGEAWLEVTAALADVLGVVVLRVPTARSGFRPVSQHQAARLAPRIRQHDAVLISVGDWPRAEARLSIRDSQWTGIGRGHGRLTGRRARVIAELATGQVREAHLLLPGDDHQVRVVDTPDRTPELYAVRAG